MTAYLDEHLDDPDAADVAGAASPTRCWPRSAPSAPGAMREIVATIQAEQDLVIRAPIDQVLVVQGGPGTGKTAVALHRAAYLLFEHRRRLARDGVLVIGPNRAFLDYIGNVLPSLGERSVRQCTVLDLCLPKVEITGARRAGRRPGPRAPSRCSTSCSCAATLAVTPPADDVVVPIGARRIAFAPRRDRRVAGPGGRRRDPVQPAAPAAAGDRPAGAAAAAPAATTRGRRPGRCARRSTRRGRRSSRSGSSTACSPRGRRGRKRAWTAADQLLVDEANSILNGPPLMYGHVVVDEAQDHSAVALRVIGRRTPAALDDARRRRRPVDDAGRPGALGRRLRLPVRGRGGGRRARSPS